MLKICWLFSVIVSVIVFRRTAAPAPPPIPPPAQPLDLLPLLNFAKEWAPKFNYEEKKTMSIMTSSIQGIPGVMGFSGNCGTETRTCTTMAEDKTTQEFRIHSKRVRRDICNSIHNAIVGYSVSVDDFNELMDVVRCNGEGDYMGEENEANSSPKPTL